MKALVYNGARDVRVKEVPDARIHELPLDEAPDAYEHFDARHEGWTKVVLKPAMAATSAGKRKEHSHSAA